MPHKVTKLAPKTNKYRTTAIVKATSNEPSATAEYPVKYLNANT